MLLRWQACVGISAAAFLVYLGGNAIAAATYADAKPLWERDCYIANPEKVTVTCGDYAETMEVSAVLADALASTSLATHCTGTRTRGIFGGISLACKSAGAK